MAVTRIYVPLLLLCLFIINTVATWPTLTNPFWLAATLSMINLQPRVRRQRCYSSRANGTPAAPIADSKRHALISARTSSLALPQDPSPSRSILTFRRPSFADHPCAFFCSGGYNTALFWTTSTRFDLRETSVTTFTFFSGDLFLLCPYSPLQI